MKDDDASDLVIRPMTRADLDVAVAWAAAEGWNPGMNDAECFFAADSEGFLMGFHDGEPAASVSVIRYDQSFGFLGFYIARPDLRGRGYGHRLWRAGMERLADCVVGLDGVVAQQENYRKSGFELAHRNIRFGGTVHIDPPLDPSLREVDETLLTAILVYDRAFFPAPREAFLRCWLRPERRRAVALVEDGSLRGYGVIRACGTGFKIGPLFAEDERDADLLFRALATEAKGEPVFFDPPAPNRAALMLAMRYGLKDVFETARMYRGAAPVLPLSRTYGITTFELG